LEGVGEVVCGETAVRVRGKGGINIMRGGRERWRDEDGEIWKEWRDRGARKVER
jgi:hypothetical protein